MLFQCVYVSDKGRQEMSQTLQDLGNFTTKCKVGYWFGFWAKKKSVEKMAAFMLSGSVFNPYYLKSYKDHARQ